MAALRLYGELRAQRIWCRVQNGRLDIEAPKGAVTPDHRARLLDAKDDLIRLFSELCPCPECASRRREPPRHPSLLRVRSRRGPAVGGAASRVRCAGRGRRARGDPGGRLHCGRTRGAQGREEGERLVRLKRERSVSVELVCIQGWRALAVRGHSQLCRGVFLPREEVPWLVSEMRPLLIAPTGPIPVHIARAWGPLRVLVSPKGVRLWRRSGSWPVEGVAIAATEARDVAALLDRSPPRGLPHRLRRPRPAYAPR